MATGVCFGMCVRELGVKGTEGAASVLGGGKEYGT